MWDSLGKAFCLLLILEGFLPFLYPQRWRKVVEALATVSDGQLRTMGFISMLAGVLLLYVIH